MTVTARRGLLAAVAAGLLAVPTAASAQQGTARDSTARDTTERRATSRLAPVLVRGARLVDEVDARGATRADAVRLRAAPPGPAALADALTGLPGVSAFDDQGTRAQPTLDVRGFPLSPVVGVPQGVSVFLDGVRVNEADAQEVNFDLLPTDAIARAELVRGPQPVFGKNSLAGALLLTTRRGDAEPHVDAGTEVGAFGYRAARLSGSGAARGLDGFAMLRASDEDGWRADTPARTRLLFATAGRRRADDDLALTLLAGRNRIYQAGSLPASWLAADPRANFTAGDYYAPTLLHVALRGERALGARAADAMMRPHLRGNAFVRVNDTERFNVNVDAPSVRSRTSVRSMGATGEVAAPLRVGGVALDLVAGVEAARHAVGYRVYQQASGDAGPEDDCEPETGLCERARVVEDDLAAYAQATAPLGARLSLNAAARADWVRVPFRDLREPDNDGTSVFRRVSPRVGLTWSPGERLRTYAAAGVGFRAPAPLELACADEAAPCSLPFALGDDPPLAAVRVRDVEAGAELTPAPGVHVAATAWRADTRDEIVFVAARTTAGYFQNVPRTARRGVELSGSAALPRGARVSASYAWVDARWRSAARLASADPEAAPVRPGDRMPLSPAHRATAAAGLSRVAHGWALDGELSLRAVSRQWLRGDEAARKAPLPGYATVGVRLAADRARFGVAVSLTNALDAREATFGTYGQNPLGPPGGAGHAPAALERFLTPMAPRALTLALTVRR